MNNVSENAVAVDAPAKMLQSSARVLNQGGQRVPFLDFRQGQRTRSHAVSDPSEEA